MLEYCICWSSAGQLAGRSCYTHHERSYWDLVLVTRAHGWQQATSMGSWLLGLVVQLFER